MENRTERIEQTKPREIPLTSTENYAKGCLKNLRRTLAIRYQAEKYLGETDIRVLDRVILSRLCDLRNLGLGTEASRIIANAVYPTNSDNK